MYKLITLGGHDVEMVANAATPYRYKQIFHEDLLQFLTGKKSEEEQSLALQQLAYVMAMQGQKADFDKLNFDTYMEWVEQFDAMDLINKAKAGEIMAVYAGNQKTNSVAKKNKEQQ